MLTPLRAFATNPDTADRLVDWILQSTVDHGITERLALLQRRLERNEQRQEKALAAYTEGGFPLDMIQKHRAELLEEKRRLQDEMERLEQRRLSKEALRSQRDRWMEMLNVFRHLDEYDPVTARAALSAVVECVVLTPDRRLHVLWKWCACDCTCVNAPQKRYGYCANRRLEKWRSLDERQTAARSCQVVA